MAHWTDETLRQHCHVLVQISAALVVRAELPFLHVAEPIPGLTGDCQSTPAVNAFAFGLPVLSYSRYKRAVEFGLVTALGLFNNSLLL